jgi:2-polyprenyl-3-methyl-5-hydroxy-6-metoxy-1,4-benzoquinol methylase
MVEKLYGSFYFSGAFLVSCYLCGDRDYYIVPGKLRDSDSLFMKKCQSCDLVYISDKSHIVDGFYEDSNMLSEDLKSDVSMWEKTNKPDTDRRIKQFKSSIANKVILDVGCGAGSFVKKATEYVKEASVIEVDNILNEYLSKTCENISFYKSAKSIPEDKKFDYIFLFHVIEHLIDPVAHLRELQKRLVPGGSIVIEVPNANDALCSLYDCKEFKDFFYWKCHLYYFSQSTLAKLASKTNLKVDYIKQIQRYPLSNHLHWLRHGKPGGHEKLNFLDSDLLNSEYEKSLASIGKCDTLLMKLTKV